MTGRRRATSSAGPVAGAAALVVDDDHDLCRILELALTGSGCSVTTAVTAKAALAVAAPNSFCVAFVDARLPDMDGWRLVAELRQRRAAARIVMVSGYYFADDLRVAEAVQSGAIDGFLAKPFSLAAIVDEANRTTGIGTQARAGGSARPSSAAAPVSAATLPARH